MLKKKNSKFNETKPYFIHIYMCFMIIDINIIKPAEVNANKFPNIINKKIENTLLCTGKLTKAWGLGGLFKHHSKEI